jgi:hypothetical protein
VAPELLPNPIFQFTKNHGVVILEAWNGQAEESESGSVTLPDLRHKIDQIWKNTAKGDRPPTNQENNVGFYVPSLVIPDLIGNLHVCNGTFVGRLKQYGSVALFSEQKNITST